MLTRFPRQGIVRCPQCDLVFYSGDIPTAELYSTDYFSGGEYLDYVADKATIQRNFRNRIEYLRQLAPTGRLLELGSAFGFFLELAQDHWEVRGLDITSEGVDHARNVLGVRAELVDFLELPDELTTYDVICMWDTVEHLPHPVRFVEKAARWLKPGGVLAITTGDIGSVIARFRRDRWRLIHTPTHLFYFSAATLRKAVEGTGLRVHHVSHVGYYRSYKGMAYGVFVLGHKNLGWLYQLLTFGGKLEFPVYLNLRDIMMLIAKKPWTRPRPHKSFVADGP